MSGMDPNGSIIHTYRVLADYDVNDPHPLILEAGTPVEIVRDDSGWPGWVWIRSGEQSGWIPESYLGERSGHECRTIKDFNGKDLSAKRGQILTAKEHASGWILATDGAGQTGWFPLFNLRPAQ